MASAAAAAAPAGGDEGQRRSAAIAAAKRIADALREMYTETQRRRRDRDGAGALREFRGRLASIVNNIEAHQRSSEEKGEVLPACGATHTLASAMCCFVAFSFASGVLSPNRVARQHLYHALGDDRIEKMRDRGDGGAASAAPPRSLGSGRDRDREDRAMAASRVYPGLESMWEWMCTFDSSEEIVSHLSGVLMEHITGDQVFPYGMCNPVMDDFERFVVGFATWIPGGVLHAVDPVSGMPESSPGGAAAASSSARSRRHRRRMTIAQAVRSERARDAEHDRRVALRRTGSDATSSSSSGEDEDDSDDSDDASEEIDTSESASSDGYDDSDDADSDESDFVVPDGVVVAIASDTSSDGVIEEVEDEDGEEDEDDD